MSEPSEWREGVRLRHLLGEQEALALRYLARATKAEADRESIASYFEHVAACQVGSLIDAFTPRETLSYAAAWVRNRVDEKHHAEVAANTPVRADARAKGET